MSNFNGEFGECADIIPAFVPSDMHTGANNGQWVNMKNIGRLVLVLFKASGTAGDDPVLTVSQATNNAGANSKSLPFSRIRTKVNASLTSLTQWNLVTQAAANTFTTTSAANPGVEMIEVVPTDLDINNGFNHVQLSVPATTASQLGAAFYIAVAERYEQGALNPLPNALS